MLNIEKYAEEIKKKGGLQDAAVTKNGEVVGCFELDCTDCLFDDENCSHNFIDWLKSEYEEKPIVTDAEYHFCKMLGSGKMYRECGDLYFSRNGSHTATAVWDAIEILGYCVRDLKFDYVKTETATDEIIRMYEESHGIKRKTPAEV